MLNQFYVGQRWRWKGPSSEHYTPGKVYEIMALPRGDMMQVADNKGGPHHWDPDESFLAMFEWDGSPVQTITSTRVVSGTYGIVNVAVAPGTVAVFVKNKFYSGAEIREAAAVLAAIADAMEAGQ